MELTKRKIGDDKSLSNSNKRIKPEIIISNRLVQPQHLGKDVILKIAKYLIKNTNDVHQWKKTCRFVYITLHTDIPFCMNAFRYETPRIILSQFKNSIWRDISSNFEIVPSTIIHELQDNVYIVNTIMNFSFIDDRPFLSMDEYEDLSTIITEMDLRLEHRSKISPFHTFHMSIKLKSRKGEDEYFQYIMDKNDASGFNLETDFALGCLVFRNTKESTCSVNGSLDLHCYPEKGGGMSLSNTDIIYLDGKKHKEEMDKINFKLFLY